MSQLFQRSLAFAVGLYRSYSTNRRIEPLDAADERRKWAKALNTKDERDARSDAIGRAYAGAVDRGVRVESKAIGYLQVLAIAFTIVTLVLTRDSILLRSLSLVALIFLTLSTVGALEVLKSRQRAQALVSDALSKTDGLAEAAVAAALMERQQIESSNFLAGARSDLAVGGACALASLLLMVFGVGNSSDPLAPAPAESVESTMQDQSTSLPSTTDALVPSTAGPSHPSSSVVTTSTVTTAPASVAATSFSTTAAPVLETRTTPPGTQPATSVSTAVATSSLPPP